MPGTSEILLALEQIFTTKILELFVGFIVAATVMLLLKIIAEAIAGHIQFRLDKHISIGSPVEIYGKKGRVRDVTLFTITVETDCGFIRIPTKSWRASKFLMLKDQIFFYNKRKEDKKNKEL